MGSPRLAAAASDSIGCRFDADACEDAAQSAHCGQGGSERLYRRNGIARDITRLLSRRNSIPAFHTGAVPGRSHSARTLETWPAREPALLFSTCAGHQSRTARLCGILLRHGRLQRYAANAPCIQRMAGAVVVL